MTTSHQILHDLKTGQSSTSALADRVHQPEKIIEAFCHDLEIDGLIEKTTIHNTITVWRITDAGRIVIADLTVPIKKTA